MAALTIQKHVDDDINQQRELFLWKFGKDGITREDLQKEQAVSDRASGLVLAQYRAAHTLTRCILLCLT
jgi:hypothetical protein